MKKVFLVILSMCLIISMVGCGQTEKIEKIEKIEKVEKVEQKEPIEIQLTKENFDEYIILNVNINDFEIDSSRGVSYLLGYDSYEYTGIANLEVEARLKKDVKVNNVKISGRISTTGMCWAMKNFDFSLQLDKNGEGDISNQITTGDSSLVKPDRPTLFKFYNYSPSGNEFLINNDEVLITSLEGTITVSE